MAAQWPFAAAKPAVRARLLPGFARAERLIPQPPRELEGDELSVAVDTGTQRPLGGVVAQGTAHLIAKTTTLERMLASRLRGRLP